MNFHASKAQAIITAEGRILFLDIQSRRDLSEASEILADNWLSRINEVVSTS